MVSGISADPAVQLEPGTVFAEFGPVESGSYLVGGVQMSWSRAQDGTLSAHGGGQEYVGRTVVDADGTEHRTATFAMSGQAPYMSMELTSRSSQRSVETTCMAGASHLTLAITGIDLGVTSGAATVTGSVGGVAISWTGSVDLTSNPFIGNPVPGWPPDAFATEFNRASVFGPVAGAVTQPRAGTGPLTGHPPQGGPGHVHPMSAAGVFERAGAWCVGGAYAGKSAGPEGMVAGCIGGAVASIASDLFTWIDEGGGTVEPEPVPVIDLPPDPDPIGPTTETQHDDPPPPADGESAGGVSDAGGAGGGKPIADDDDPETELHEA